MSGDWLAVQRLGFVKVSQVEHLAKLRLYFLLVSLIPDEVLPSHRNDDHNEGPCTHTLCGCNGIPPEERLTLREINDALAKARHAPGVYKVNVTR